MGKTEVHGVIAEVLQTGPGLYLCYDCALQPYSLLLLNTQIKMETTVSRNNHYDLVCSLWLALLLTHCTKLPACSKLPHFIITFLEYYIL